MKQAVIFGAGNIGRGFIGQTCSLSGYLVTFVDIFPTVVDALNQAGQYPVQIVSSEETATVQVGPVKALLASQVEQVADAVAAADLMATAVGVNALPSLAPVLAAGFRRRWLQPASRPLDILICENKLDAGHYLRELVRDQLITAESEKLDRQIGFVEASIGRMVPLMPEALKKEQPLLIQVEPYCELPVDAAGFRGPIPGLKGLKPFAPFAFYIKRKLYVHNLGHAITAYLGWLRGYATIAGAILDPAVQPLVRQAMRESAAALAKGYQVPAAELDAHVEDLISRFANHRLGDTVFRVGRDPLRKLAADDRLAGGLRYVLEQGLQPQAIALGLAAGLYFDPAGDPSSLELQQRLQQEGADAFLAGHSGLSGSPQLNQWRSLIILLNRALNLGSRNSEVPGDEC